MSSYRRALSVFGELDHPRRVEQVELSLTVVSEMGDELRAAARGYARLSFHVDRRRICFRYDQAGWRAARPVRPGRAEGGGEEVALRWMALIGHGKLMVGADHGGYRPELDAGPAEHVAA